MTAARFATTLALLAAPAAAGVLYVPVAFDSPVSGVAVRGELEVANPATDLQAITTLFLGAGTDGTVRPDEDPPATFVAPESALLLSPLVFSGGRGMLEIGGSDLLELRARLISYSGSTVLDRVELPLLTSGNVLAAGETGWLVGLDDDATTATAVGVVNLGQALANCHATVRGAAGELYLGNVDFGINPVSMLQFDDVFALLGLAVVPEGARIGIECDQPYWNYALQVTPSTGRLELTVPSRSTGDSTLSTPSTGGDVSFSASGVFLECTAGNKDFRFPLPFAEPTEYEKVEIQFDVYISGWDPDKPAGYHTLLWFNNGPAWSTDMMVYMNVLPDDNKVKVQSNQGDDTNHTKTPAPQPGEWYHVLWESNLSGESEFYYKITRLSNGSTVQGALLQNTYSQFIAATDGFLSFGSQTSNGPESNTYGWKFRDLEVKYFESGL